MNALDTARYFLGAAGLKAEQLSNGFRKITGQAEIEFENMSDVYTAFAADTATALQLVYTGVVSGSTNLGLKILIPNIHFDEGSPSVDGPKVLTQKVAFTGLDDTINPPIQLQYTSLDSAV
jgi:hypothetical protein